MNQLSIDRATFNKLVYDSNILGPVKVQINNIDLLLYSREQAVKIFEQMNKTN